MKKVFVFFFILIPLISTLALPAFAEENQTICLLEESVAIGPFLNPERSGCCSWHDGVCGCTSSGRVICCDGTLSPSCGC